MDEDLPLRILLLAADAASARRWADMLADLDAQVWLDAADLPPGEQPDVVVTCGAGVPPAYADGRRDACTTIEQAENSPYVGVVRIGGDDSSAPHPAEVRLPTDATARELQLACRLLARIVRLQRQQQAGAEQQRRLAAEALTDPLTGLPNRRAWDRTLTERLACLRRDESPSPAPLLCLAIFDLDLFKQINDSQGHAAGDAVLRACGAALRGGLRQDDFVARLGGDEFGLLLWVRDADAAAATVERVRAALPGQLSAASLAPVTASAGYCVAAETLESAAPLPCSAALFTAADAALRAAKQAGRNQTRGTT